VLSPRLAQRPGHRDVAALHAGEALALARQQGNRGSEATTLRLMGDITSADRAEAEGYYRGALALATQLGMCPLASRCHASLGQLYRRSGDRQQASEHLTMAISMFQELDMPFRLEEVKAAARELG
jgi:hypothetical protein